MKIVKKILVLLLMIGLLGGVFFSIFAMDHSHSSLVSDHCSMALSHTPVCPADALSLAGHYIAMYQAFTDGFASSIVTQAVASVLLLVVGVSIFRKYIVAIRCLVSLSGIWRFYRGFGMKLCRPQETTRWLSLLLNSPSFN